MARQKTNGSALRMYDFQVLRDLRKREGLTIGDVSERSGVSVAVISKLERNQSSAELETLYKIARVFNMSATDLIALAESPLAHRKNATSYRSDGFQFKKIIYNNASCFLATAGSGSSVTRPEIHQNDYEICWIESGKINLTLAHEQHTLSAGESIQFDAIQEHTYEALEDTRMIIIHVRKDKRY